MIPWNVFESAVVHKLRRDISSNEQQEDFVRALLQTPLFVVAGPGSGKTTVSVLRILKLIFVDAIEPNGILATTFTNKAAAELKSRVLGWGNTLKAHFAEFGQYKSFVENIDLNQVVTGTLDSLAQQLLSDYRSPGEGAPVVLQGFVTNALMTRVGLFNGGRFSDDTLKRYLADISGQTRLSVSKMSELLLDMRARFYNDRIELSQLQTDVHDDGLRVCLGAIQDYESELNEREVYDFVSLEDKFLSEISSGRLTSFLEGLRYLLVDEYQDTNALQERIYFHLSKWAVDNEGSFMVVGDDDQSLYRFRGSTVDLFHDFRDRISRFMHTEAQSYPLSGNYRSTKAIVEFCNEFVELDSVYARARAEGKVPLQPKRDGDYVNFPVLGMFRDDVESLARDLSDFVGRVLHDGFTVRVNDESPPLVIQVDQHRGSPSDIAYLCASPREYKSDNQTPRLPLLLRQHLQDRNVRVFNPRGQQLNRVPSVQLLRGLLLECIDPSSSVERTIERLPSEARSTFNGWRRQATDAMANLTERVGGVTLAQFVQRWKTRNPTTGRRFDGGYPLKKRYATGVLT